MARQPEVRAFARKTVESLVKSELVASDDEWTAPIMAEVGPDGHVWVIDWYNIIVQHNPIPRGFERGKGGAYQTDLRDKTHGRVVRVDSSDLDAKLGDGK